LSEKEYSDKNYGEMENGGILTYTLCFLLNSIKNDDY